MPCSLKHSRKVSWRTCVYFVETQFDWKMVSWTVKFGFCVWFGACWPYFDHEMEKCSNELPQIIMLTKFGLETIWHCFEDFASNTWHATSANRDVVGLMKQENYFKIWAKFHTFSNCEVVRILRCVLQIVRKMIQRENSINFVGTFRVHFFVRCGIGRSERKTKPLFQTNVKNKLVVVRTVFASGQFCVSVVRRISVINWTTQCMPRERFQIDTLRRSSSWRGFAIYFWTKFSKCHTKVWIFVEVEND